MLAEMPAPGSFPTEAGPHPPGPLPTAGPQEAIAPISAWALGPCLGLGPSPEASGYLLAGLDERSHLDAGCPWAWPKVMGPRPSSGEASGYKWLTGGRLGPGPWERPGCQEPTEKHRPVGPSPAQPHHRHSHLLPSTHSQAPTQVIAPSLQPQRQVPLFSASYWAQRGQATSPEPPAQSCTRRGL